MYDSLLCDILLVLFENNSCEAGHLQLAFGRMAKKREAPRAVVNLLFRAAGWNAEVFGSASEFMQSNCLFKTDCIVLDMWMPGLTGLQLHEGMQDNDMHLPVVF